MESNQSQHGPEEHLNYLTLEQSPLPTLRVQKSCNSLKPNLSARSALKSIVLESKLSSVVDGCDVGIGTSFKTREKFEKDLTQMLETLIKDSMLKQSERSTDQSI